MRCTASLDTRPTGAAPPSAAMSYRGWLGSASGLTPSSPDAAKWSLELQPALGAAQAFTSRSPRAPFRARARDGFRGAAVARADRDRRRPGRAPLARTRARPAGHGRPARSRRAEPQDTRPASEKLYDTNAPNHHDAGLTNPASNLRRLSSPFAATRHPSFDDRLRHRRLPLPRAPLLAPLHPVLPATHA
jgi:hypothetical protein